MSTSSRNIALIALSLLSLPMCGSAETNADEQQVQAAGDTGAVAAATREVRAGAEHAEARRAADAAAAYQRAVEHLPAFADWAAVLAAAAAGRAGDTAAVASNLARADSTLARDWGWRTRVYAVAALGDTAAAARLAAGIAPTLPDAARQAEAWTRAGMLFLRARRNSDAIDASIGSAAAFDAARELATVGTPTAADQLKIGRVFMRHNDPTRAATAFDAYFARGKPSVSERVSIQLELGTALFNFRLYPAAERRLRAAVTAGTGASSLRGSVAQALYMLGRSQYRRGATTAARTTFARVTSQFAGTNAATRAHFTLADIDHDANRMTSARTHYRAVLSGANVADAPLAAMRLGSLAITEGRPRAAAELFRERYEREGASAAERQQMGFWWAQSLHRAGAADSAKLVYREVRDINRFSYYGMRAAQLLDDPGIQLAPAPPVPADIRARVASSLDVVDVLRDAGLDSEASFEAARVARRHNDALYALGTEYHARGQTARGITIGREIQRTEGTWNRTSLELVYPFPFRDEITASARANEVDPFLMAGLIRQESMFNPRARSVAGALGLMQVMPATGRRVASGIGMSFNASQLTDPAVNLRLGAKYLADQIETQGRVIDAVAAYNAGPHRLDEWRGFPEYRDDDLFIERIPYQETRDYVKVVNQNARIYRLLYGDMTD
jgi:soluble lytic murein transglycosylase